MKQLFTDRERVRKLEKSLGIGHLSEPAKSVYAFIANGPTTIAVMFRHAFFEGTSMSTIKRAVDQLKNEGLIKSTKGKVDARKRFLFLTEN